MVPLFIGLALATLGIALTRDFRGLASYMGTKNHESRPRWFFQYPTREAAIKDAQRIGRIAAAMAGVLLMVSALNMLGL